MGIIEPGRKGPSVLFVCTANICRSPIAAALFLARLKKERPDWQAWRIESAGTWAQDGDMAAKYSRQVMADRGLNISDHKAKTVTAEMLESYDLVLVMEVGHKEALQVEFPAVARRIFLLSEMEGLELSVEDPYGRSVEAFEEMAQKIDQILAKGMQRIVTLAAGRHAEQQTRS